MSPRLFGNGSYLRNLQMLSQIKVVYEYCIITSNNFPLDVYHRRKISSGYTHTSKVRKGEIKSK